MAPIKHAQPVTVSLNDLKSGSVPFSSLLSAFGPDSLGILVVTDLPSSFPTLRSSVLSNSSRLAALPSQTLQSLTNPSAKYLVGWSHGVETLRPGVVDTAKGSYYMNCSFYQDPSLEGDDASKHPGFEEHTAPNLWPSDSLIPEFENDAKSLISLIIDVAILVARACDTYASQEIPDYKPNYLEHVVKTSLTSKARLLHYFPTSSSTSTSPPPSTSSASDEENDDWCATHLDHGCLTGLTSAMFIDESSSTDKLTETPSPSPPAGLYIKSRTSTIHKVSIPRDALAFQTGETLELITQGKFKAVPHFVRGVDATDLDGEKASMKVARNTLAVFTQPNLDEVVDVKTGMTFGEFARGVVGRNTAG
jgi:isopenicillin N synthase-like dioxygenase